MAFTKAANSLELEWDEYGILKCLSCLMLYWPLQPVMMKWYVFFAFSTASTVVGLFDIYRRKT